MLIYVDPTQIMVPPRPKYTLGTRGEPEENQRTCHFAGLLEVHETDDVDGVTGKVQAVPSQHVAAADVTDTGVCLLIIALGVRVSSPDTISCAYSTRHSCSRCLQVSAWLQWLQCEREAARAQHSVLRPVYPNPGPGT